MKSGESGKECKSVVAQKDNRERNLAENIQLLTRLYLKHSHRLFPSVSRFGLAVIKTLG